MDCHTIGFSSSRPLRRWWRDRIWCLQHPSSPWWECCSKATPCMCLKARQMVYQRLKPTLFSARMLSLIMCSLIMLFFDRNNTCIATCTSQPHSLKKCECIAKQCHQMMQWSQVLSRLHSYWQVWWWWTLQYCSIWKSTCVAEHDAHSGLWYHQSHSGWACRILWTSWICGRNLWCSHETWGEA